MMSETRQWLAAAVSQRLVGAIFERHGGQLRIFPMKSQPSYDLMRRSPFVHPSIRPEVAWPMALTEQTFCEMVRALVIWTALFADRLRPPPSLLNGLRLARLLAEVIEDGIPRYRPPPEPDAELLEQRWQQAVEQVPIPVLPPALRARLDTLHLRQGMALMWDRAPALLLQEGPLENVTAESPHEWLLDLLGRSPFEPLLRLADSFQSTVGAWPGEPQQRLDDEAFRVRLATGQPIRGTRGAYRGICIRQLYGQILITVDLPPHFAGTGLEAEDGTPAYVQWPAGQAHIALDPSVMLPASGLVGGFKTGCRSLEWHPMVSLPPDKAEGSICISDSAQVIGDQAVAFGRSPGEVLAEQIRTVQLAFLFGYREGNAGMVFHPYSQVALWSSTNLPYRLVPEPEARAAARTMRVALVPWSRPVVRAAGW